MKTQDTRKPDPRQQRKLASMRQAQDAALHLFESLGFDRVTMEDVARAAGVGPATLYRNFGTKERLLLWDEYDPMLLDALSQHLGTRPLLDALERGLVDALDGVYRQDATRILRRARFILGTPAVRAASVNDLQQLRAQLAALFVQMRAIPSPLAAEVMAATVTGVLDVAVTAWVTSNGKVPLRTLMGRAFEALRRHTA